MYYTASPFVLHRSPFFKVGFSGAFAPHTSVLMSTLFSLLFETVQVDGMESLVTYFSLSFFLAIYSRIGLGWYIYRHLYLNKGVEAVYGKCKRKKIMISLR